jgi:multiple sugar transport system permease protein
VPLSNYITTVSARAANPFGAVLAGACVLATPTVTLFLFYQRRFISSASSPG